MIRSGTFSAEIKPEELLDHPITKTRQLLMMLCNPEWLSDAENNLPQLLRLREALSELEGDRTRKYSDAMTYERDHRITIPPDKLRSRKPEWNQAREHNRDLLYAVHAAARETEKVKKLQRLLYEAIANSQCEAIKEVLRN